MMTNARDTRAHNGGHGLAPPISLNAAMAIVVSVSAVACVDTEATRSVTETGQPAMVTYVGKDVADLIESTQRSSVDEGVIEMRTWRSRDGKGPLITLHIAKLKRGNAFRTPVFTISGNAEADQRMNEEMIEELVGQRAVVFGVAGESRNGTGSLAYGRFRLGSGAQCVYLVQYRGGLPAFDYVEGGRYPAGTTRIIGYYCGEEGATLSDEDMQEFFNGVRPT